MKRLSKTLFMVHMPDVNNMRAILHRQEKPSPTYEENELLYLNSVHVRKYIPPRSILRQRFDLFWEWVVLRSDSTEGLKDPLPYNALKKIHDQQLKYIGEGLISGASFITIYMCSARPCYLVVESVLISIYHTYMFMGEGQSP